MSRVATYLTKQSGGIGSETGDQKVARDLTPLAQRNSEVRDLRRGPGTILRLSRWVGIAVLAALFGSSSSVCHAEPMPTLMKALLEVFPEQNGWFIEGPVGAVPGIPDEVRPFFECPRVLVPEYPKIDLAAGKVLSAGLKLPVKKITRYDRKPGVVGLPGFRGVWCAGEEKPVTGFLLLTPNENRYLLWARRCFYPAFAVDSIQGKIRDAYARAVADHLTSVDYGVPAAVPPAAAERGLPAWMDLYPDTVESTPEQTAKFDSLMGVAAEMKFFGCSGFTEIVPTQAMVDRFTSAASETLFENQSLAALQDEYRDFLLTHAKKSPVITLSGSGFDSLATGWYIFAIDRYRRVRVAPTAEPGVAKKVADQSVKRPILTNHALLFPDQPLLAAGRFEILVRDSHRTLRTVTAWSDHFFYSPRSTTMKQDIVDRSDTFLLTLGHFFASLKDMGVQLGDLRLRKF